MKMMRSLREQIMRKPRSSSKPTSKRAHTQTLKGRDKKLAEKQVVYKMRDATKKCKSCKGEKTGMCAPSTIDELEIGLRKIKNGKVEGFGKVSNELLKHLPPTGKQALLRLFNLSFSSGVCAGNGDRVK